jgi:hypothetical protein
MSLKCPMSQSPQESEARALVLWTALLLELECVAIGDVPATFRDLAVLGCYLVNKASGHFLSALTLSASHRSAVLDNAY